MMSRYLFIVAQIFNLLYRRFVIGGRLRASGRWQVKNFKNQHYRVARQSRNQTPPLLHQVEGGAGERRGRPSPRYSPHSCVVGRGRRKPRGKKSSQPATISTGTNRLQVCDTSAAGTLNLSRGRGEGEPSVARPTVHSVFERKLGARQPRLLFALAIFILGSMLLEADEVGFGPPVSVPRDLTESA